MYSYISYNIHYCVYYYNIYSLLYKMLYSDNKYIFMTHENVFVVTI